MITPEVQEAVKKVLRDDFERLLDDATLIHGKEQEIRRLYDWIARKRLDFHNATHSRKYEGYYNGWNTVSLYKQFKENKQRRLRK